MRTAIPYRLVAYHAQQCAEKCLKAYLVAGMTDFPYTHNIGILLELCSKTGSWVPEVQDAEALSSYAVTARYPGGADRVSRREAVTAIACAERVLRTVAGDLKRRKFL
jgi:HEPN domain-containing protein